MIALIGTAGSAGPIGCGLGAATGSVISASLGAGWASESVGCVGCAPAVPASGSVSLRGTALRVSSGVGSEAGCSVDSLAMVQSRLGPAARDLT